MPNERPVSARLYLALYWLIAVLVLLAAGWLRFRLPMWPIADPDSWGYLRPSVLRLSGGSFEHSQARNFLYPGFLLLILAAARTFRAITLVQHSLGLATGVLLILCWNKLRRFLRAVPAPVHHSLGLALAAIYLCSNLPIRYEHQLRPEAITPFFAILNVLLMLRFLELRERVGPSLAGTVAAMLLVTNSILLATLKTSFVLTALFAVTPVLFALFDHRERWPRRLFIIGTGMAVSLAVILPERALARADPVAHAFLPASLFTIHANLILRQMEEDILQGDCQPYPCEWLREVANSLHEEMAKSWELNKHYREFAFDPDYLLYDRESIRLWTKRFFNNDYEKQLEFYRFYYRRTFIQHPSRMAGKVISQLAIFYTISNPSFYTEAKIGLAPYYKNTVDLLRTPPEAAHYPPLQDYLGQSESLSSTAEAIGQPIFLRWANRLLSWIYLPVLLCVLAAGVALAFVPRLRHSHGCFFGAALLIYSYNFGNSLGTAIVHSLSIRRYLWTQYSFTLLSECIGILFLVDLVWTWAARRRS